MEHLLEDIKYYWTKRADGYSKVNQEELFSEQKEKWRNAIIENIAGENYSEMKVLDVGTGPGFFAILLAEMGFQVTAIDYTDEMLRKASQNAGGLSERINWQRMDAQKLAFAKDTFDLVVTRNVTWNLENPEAAYSEWYRVLKKGGKVINFDANWYRYLYEPKMKTGYEMDRENAKKSRVEDYYEGTDIAEMERIAKKVPLSKIKRPQWDLEIMKKIGFGICQADEKIGDLILSEAEKINYRSTPIFMVQGVR